MSDTPDTAPAFEPYPCSLGTVIGYDGDTYLVAIADGRTIGIQANGEPSAENVEADIAHQPTRTATAAEIKAEAQRRILAIAPAWKQSNLIARVLELTRQYGPPVEDWPAEAQAENAAAQVIWDKVKAIREHSDILEALPPPLDALESAGWPY